MVQGRLTLEAYYCWPFPHTGLPHHRRLPGPSESQGTPRLTVAWQQKAHVWKRSPRRPRCPGFWDMQKPVGSQPEGPMPDWPAPGLALASRQGPAVPRSFLTTEPGLFPTLQPWTLCPGHEGLAWPLMGQAWGWPRQGLARWFSGAGADCGPLPASALPLPSCPPAPSSGLWSGRCSANEPETASSGGWCFLGFSMGKVTL